MRCMCSAAAAIALGCILGVGSANAGVAFRLNAGLSRISYGQYNEMVDEMNREISSDPSISGEIDNFHWLPEFSGEALFSVSPTVRIGIGVGVISGKSSFSVEPLEVGFEHTVKAFPFTATAYVNPPVPFSFAKPYVFGGAGAYYSKLGFTVSSPVDTSAYDCDLSAWGFGLHGGAGVEFSIAPKVSFSVEIRGRWAKLKGFEGTATRGDGATEDMYLAYYEESGIIEYSPESVDKKDTYGEGTVDLSGFGVLLGLKVAF
jgi:opacity protein-like surface antigen